MNTLDHGGRHERVKVIRSRLVDDAVTHAAGPGTLLDDRLTVACGEGAVRLVELQRAGKTAMLAEELLRGLALLPGTRLPG